MNSKVKTLKMLKGYLYQIKEYENSGRFVTTFTWSPISHMRKEDYSLITISFV